MAENDASTPAKRRGGRQKGRDPVDPEFGARLKQAVRRGGNTGVVAKRIGVPERTLQGYMRGADMRRTTLVQIADACGVSIEWLAAGRGHEAAEWVNPRVIAQPPLGEQPGGTFVSGGPFMPIKDDRSPSADLVMKSGDHATVVQVKTAPQVKIDQKTLADAVEIAEKAFAARRKSPSYARKAKVIRLIYEELTDPEDSEDSSSE